MLCSQSEKKKKKSSKMMKRRERGDVLVAPEIPLDLVTEILNRLPIKSLARFKCVSKLWSSLITSQGSVFASPPRLYISSIVENKFELLSLSLAFMSKISTVFNSKSSTVFDLDLTKHGIGGDYMMALRGLILYTVSEQSCIYNPTTGQRVVLPRIKAKKYRQQQDYFLGYDPVLDQYKVVCTVVWSQMYTEHWVFVLEAGNSWKRIDFDHHHSPMRQRVCINGVIYYLHFSTVYRGIACIAISFDVRSEEFNMIQVPSVVYEYLDSWSFELIEYGGKPTIFDFKHQQNPLGLLNLWVLEDAGKWSRKSLVLQPFHMHFFKPQLLGDARRYWNYFQVIGTTLNGEVIFRLKNLFYPYCIIYYDLHTNNVRRVDIRGISEYPFEFALMDTGESIMHLKI